MADYTRDEVVSYLRNNGVKYKKASGGKEIVLDCVYCGKKEHLYMSLKQHNPGYHDCKVCGCGGSFRSYMRQRGDLPERKSNHKESSYLADKGLSFRMPSKSYEPKTKPTAGVDTEYHGILFDKESQDEVTTECLEYLTKQRALSEMVLKLHKVGLVELESWNRKTKEKEFIDCIALPYYNNAGVLVGLKYRGLRDKKFMRRWKDCISSLYGLELLDKTQDAVIIVEGEFDAMAMETYGYGNVLSVPNGARSWDHTWNREISAFDTVYIIPDQDENEVGQEGAKLMADKIGRFRCLNVELPYKDPNECLQSGVTKEEMDNFFEDARKFPGSEILEVGDMEDKLVKILHGGEDTVGITTGYANTDLLIGGWRPREVTVLTGDTGQGKTTRCVDFALQIVQTSQRHVLYMPFEMDPEDITAMLLSMISGKPFLDMDEPEVRYWIRELDQTPLSLLRARGAVGLEVVKEAILFSTRHLGVSHAFVDPLQYVFPPVPISEERRLINEAMLMFQELAKELYIHLFLVVHPTKLPSDKKGRRDRKVEMNDLPGSARIKQDADNVVRIWAKTDPQTGAISPDHTEVTFLKVRSFIGRTGTAWFNFNEDTLRYEETDPPSTKRKSKKKQEQDNDDSEHDGVSEQFEYAEQDDE